MYFKFENHIQNLLEFALYGLKCATKANMKEIYRITIDLYIL
jgi:hypothetical protein